MSLVRLGLVEPAEVELRYGGDVDGLTEVGDHGNGVVAPARQRRCLVPAPADSLAAFFAAAGALDSDIKAAAGVFNAGLDADAVTLDPGVGPVVDALDAQPLRALVPAGLSAGLERAVGSTGRVRRRRNRSLGG